MKALLYSAVRELELIEMPTPEPRAGEVRIRVRATGICGSDLHGYLGHQARRKPGLVLGHETTGVVDSVGSPEDAHLVGQRVAVNPLITCRVCTACRSGRQNCCPTWRLLGMDQTQGGFADAVVVPTINVHPLPDEVSDEEAVMIEPLANAIEILSKIPSSAGLFPDVVILGAGTLGSCILAVARARGLSVVAVSDKNVDRLGVARTLGALKTVDPSELEALPQVPVVVDAVGRAEAREDALRRVSKGGTVLLLGLDEGATTLDFQDIVRREVRLQGSFAYNDLHFQEAVAFVVQRRADFRPWTDSMSLKDGHAGFEKLITAPGNRLKIALKP